jgi:hypothetical protein
MEYFIHVCEGDSHHYPSAPFIYVCKGDDILQPVPVAAIFPLTPHHKNKMSNLHIIIYNTINNLISYKDNTL